MKPEKNDTILYILVVIALGLMIIGFTMDMNLYLIVIGLSIGGIGLVGGVIFLFTRMRQIGSKYIVFLTYRQAPTKKRRLCFIIKDPVVLPYDKDTSFEEDKRFQSCLAAVNSERKKALSAIGKTWVDLEPKTFYAEFTKTMAKLQKTQPEPYTQVAMCPLDREVTFPDEKDPIAVLFLLLNRDSFEEQFPRGEMDDEGLVYTIGHWEVYASDGSAVEIGRIQDDIAVARVVSSDADLNEESNLVKQTYDPTNAMIDVSRRHNKLLLTSEETYSAKLTGAIVKRDEMEEQLRQEIQRTTMLTNGTNLEEPILRARLPEAEAPPANDWKFVVGAIIGAILTYLFVVF